MGVLKRAFNYAIELKQISTNPFSELKPVSIPKKLRNRFSTKELKEVNLKHHEPQYSLPNGKINLDYQLKNIKNNCK